MNEEHTESNRRITELERDRSKSNETLIRIDERTKGMDTKIKELSDSFKSVTEAMTHNLTGYVSVEEFKPVKSVVYGAVGAILLEFMAVVFLAIGFFLKTNNP